MTNEEWLSQGYLSVDELKASYRDTRKKLNKVLVVRSILEEDPERKILNGMVASLNYAIEWMDTGRRPGNKRGVERSYETLMDPVKMQSYIRNTNAGSPANITDSHRTALRNVLGLLSDQEQNCYIMAHGYGYTYEYIASLLGISKSAVATYIKRAQNKVSKEVQKDMYAVI
jgi:DNA-directed RNA polymerase specialized sigma subunit